MVCPVTSVFDYFLHSDTDRSSTRPTLPFLPRFTAPSSSCRVHVCRASRQETTQSTAASSDGATGHRCTRAHCSCRAMPLMTAGLCFHQRLRPAGLRRAAWPAGRRAVIDGLFGGSGGPLRPRPPRAQMARLAVFIPGHGAAKIRRPVRLRSLTPRSSLDRAAVLCADPVPVMTRDVCIPPLAVSRLGFH